MKTKITLALAIVSLSFACSKGQSEAEAKAYAQKQSDSISNALSKALEAATPNEQTSHTNQQSNTTKKIVEHGWAGNYKDQFGRTLTVLSPKADGEIQFELDMTNQNCQEVFTGSVYLESETSAFNKIDEGWSIQFRLDENDNIVISETAPLGSHGGSCGDAEGTYKRK